MKFPAKSGSTVLDVRFRPRSDFYCSFFPPVSLLFSPFLVPKAEEEKNDIKCVIITHSGGRAASKRSEI